MKKRKASLCEEEIAFETKCIQHRHVPREKHMERLNEAKAEGYVSEVCGCGEIFLASDHFVRCNEKGCPMRDGQGSLLDRWKKELEKETENVVEVPEKTQD